MPSSGSTPARSRARRAPARLRRLALAALLGASCTPQPGDRPGPSPPPGPVRGGRLVLAIPQDAGVLDPQLSSEPSGFFLIRATQRGLMAFPRAPESRGDEPSPRGAATPGATLPPSVSPGTPGSSPAPFSFDPVPDLAESVSVSPDALTYSFRLREFVAFGPPASRAVEARDAKAGIERALRLGSPIAPVLRAIDGAVEFEAGRAPEIRGVRAADARSLVVTLSRPANDVLWALAHTAASAVPAGTGAAIAAGAIAASGPYRIQHARPGEEILLVRNEAWQSASDPIRRAYVDQIRVVVGTAEGADVVGEEFPPPPGTEERTAGGGCLLYLFASPRDARLADPRVRRGIAAAIDRTRLLREAGGAAPELSGVPFAALLPPGAAGAVARRVPPGDAAAARSLIGGGFSIPLARESTGPDARGDEAVAAAVAEMLAASGIRTTPLRPAPPGSIYDRYEARAAAFGVARWCADWPGRNGRSAIGALLATGGASNWSSTSDARLDAVVDAATRAGGPAAIAAAWRAAEEHALSLGAVVPLAFLTESVPVSGRLRGFEPHPFFLRGDPAGLWLDPRPPPPESIPPVAMTAQRPSDKLAVVSAEWRVR